MTTTEKLAATYDVTNMLVYIEGRFTNRLSPPLKVTGYEIANMIEMARREVEKYTGMIKALEAKLDE